MSAPSSLAEFALVEEPGALTVDVPGLKNGGTRKLGYWSPLARAAFALDDALTAFAPEARLEFVDELIAALTRDAKRLR